MAFAGLYEFWRDRAVADPDDPCAWLTTFTIITTAPSPGLDRIHDRQPLVLEPEDWAAWLDPATGAADVLGLLEPRAARPVRRPTRSRAAVSSNRSNGPHLLEPVPRRGAGRRRRPGDR